MQKWVLLPTFVLLLKINIIMNIINTIKTHLRKYLMLPNILKTDTTETNFEIIKKGCTFKDINKTEDNFIINKYYNGDSQKYMDEKDEINSKLNELKELIIKARKRVIGYSEFMRIEEILIDLGGITKVEFETLLQKYNYNFDLLYQSITEDKNKPKIDQIKTSEIIGTLSGTTMSIEYKIATNYEDFIREYKKNH